MYSLCVRDSLPAIHHILRSTPDSLHEVEATYIKAFSHVKKGMTITEMYIHFPHTQCNNWLKFLGFIAASNTSSASLLWWETGSLFFLVIADNWLK